MGFWDKLFKGKVYEDNRNPTMAGELELCGDKYLLSEFDLDFDREDNAREYFRAYAVFTDSASASVESWILNSGKKESGKVRFYLNSDAMDAGALFEITFSNASCVQYRKHVHGGVHTTTIVMTIPVISVAGEEYEISK